MHCFSSSDNSSFNRNILLKGISYSWLIFFLAHVNQGSQFYGFLTPFSLFQTFRQSLSLVNLKINYFLVIFASLVACLLFQAMLTPVHCCSVGPSLVMLYQLKNRLQYNWSYSSFPAKTCTLCQHCTSNLFCTALSQTYLTVGQWCTGNCLVQNWPRQI